MQLREAIEELRATGYRVMDFPDGEVEDNVAMYYAEWKLEQIEEVLQHMLKDELHYGSWQEVPVTKEQIQGLPEMDDDAFQKLLWRKIASVEYQPRMSEEEESRFKSPEEAYEAGSALNAADVEEYQKRLEDAGIPTEITQNYELNAFDLTALDTSLQLGAVYETQAVAEEFTFLQKLRDERVNAYALYDSDGPSPAAGMKEDIWALQTDALGKYLMERPAIEEMDIPEPLQPLAEFTFERLKAETKNVEAYLASKGIERQAYADETVISGACRPYNDRIHEHSDAYLAGSGKMIDYLCYAAVQAGKDNPEMVQNTLAKGLAEAPTIIDGSVTLREIREACDELLLSRQEHRKRVQEIHNMNGAECLRLGNQILGAKNHADTMVAVRNNNGKAFLKCIIDGQKEFAVKKTEVAKYVKQFFQNFIKKELSELKAR